MSGDYEVKTPADLWLKRNEDEETDWFKYVSGTTDVDWSEQDLVCAETGQLIQSLNDVYTCKICKSRFQKNLKNEVCFVCHQK